MLTSDEIPHAFLFTGPTGCGKTTLGRIVAKEIGAKGNDYREVDSAQFNGVATVREIRNQAQFRPQEGKARVWLLDEVHMLGRGGNSSKNEAQNALLKALEDPPDHVYYILCTTDPQQLLPTIRGRCQHFQGQALSEKVMVRLLRTVVKAEGCSLSKEIYYQIAEDSLGQGRDALQILEQVLCAPEDKRLEVAKRTAEIQNQSIELCRALMKGEGWESVRGILSGLQDQEPEGIRRHVLKYCQTTLLKSSNTQAAAIMEEMIEPFYNTGFPGLVFACYSIIYGGG
jgi:DNA polymerase-3 subunit gamma/tau